MAQSRSLLLSRDLTVMGRKVELYSYMAMCRRHECRLRELLAAATANCPIFRPRIALISY